MRSPKIGFRALFALTVVGTTACGLSVVGVVELADDDPPHGDASVPPSSDVVSSDRTVSDSRVPDAADANDGASDASDASLDASDASLDASDASLDASDASLDAGDASGCPEIAAGGGVFNGHCYFPVGPLDRPAALTACTQSGAHLVSITTAAEQAFVATLGGASSRWIGLTQPGATNDKAQFVWVTGEPASVDFWFAGQPNDMLPCVAMASDGLWSDRICTNSYVALCERD